METRQCALDQPAATPALCLMMQLQQQMISGGRLLHRAAPSPLLLLLCQA
jgi:hypothetical protein